MTGYEDLEGPRSEWRGVVPPHQPSGSDHLPPVAVATDHLPTDELTTDSAAALGANAGPARSDWNPRGPRVRRDAVSAYDQMRSRCPVARGPQGAWTLFAHADVTAAALDHEVFSNAVSTHLQVPNGLDGPTQTAFRALVERYFTRERMSALAPVLTRVAAELMAELEVPGPIDAVDVGARFAVRAQSAWLGWPAVLEQDLLRWMSENHAASRSRDRARTAEVARWFDAFIRSLTDARRELGDSAPHDVTTELVRDRVGDRELSDEEIVSILRNWTGGDLGSIALCAGVVLTYLADHAELQARLRAGVSDRALDEIIDEILRMDDPFVTSRRVTTEPVTLGGRQIPAGDQVILNWTSANRDPRIFARPSTFNSVANSPYNVVYGIGKHVCPGRPLAALELRVLTRAVLARTADLAPDPDRPRERELPPLGGYARAPLRLR